MKPCKIMTLVLLLMLCGCSASQQSEAVSSADGAQATSMHLERLEGSVNVSDGEKDIEAFAGMGLYSGYGIGTEKESYDWIMLDEVKLLKMDQSSKTSITNEGKKIKISLEEGSLFFCISDPLEEGEQLTFETQNVSLSIWGTCGIIRHYAGTSYIVMLEGEAEAKCLNNVSNSFDLKEGDVLIVPLLGYKEEEITHGDLPDFVREEILNSDMVKEKMQDSQIDHNSYMNDEEVLEYAQKFAGKYICLKSYYSKGDIPGVDFIVDEPYVIEIAFDENGHLLASAKESNEAYESVEDFNRQAQEAGISFRMPHVDMDMVFPVIRISEDNGLLLNGFVSGKLYLVEDGAYLSDYPNYFAAYKKID